MRASYRTAALLACLLALSGGCKWMDKKELAVLPKPTGRMEERQPQQFVNYLNTQASYLQSISYEDVRATAFEAGKELGNLNDSTLYSARPRNVRLIGGHTLAGTMIDLGSNDREFWMYAKPLGRDNYFYCSHDTFARGDVKFPFPFDTDWIMQALGMADYDPNGQYEVKMNEQQRVYALTQRTTTRSGQPIIKVTYFNENSDDGRKPAVRKHMILDGNDTSKIIATAEITAVKKIAVNAKPGESASIQIPTEVSLEWPQQQFRMTMKLSKERVNEDLTDRMTALFNRPQIRGTNPIDLAKYQVVVPSSYRGQMPEKRKSNSSRAWAND